MGTANASANTYIARQCDTSLSNSGWFWHTGAKPRYTASAAVDLYGLQCIGLGAGLILNLPPSTRGIVEPSFVAFASAYKAEYNRRFGSSIGSLNGSLATDMGPLDGALTLQFGSKRTLDAVIVREDLRHGQRVAAWTLEALANGAWEQIGAGSVVGMRRIWSLHPVEGPAARTGSRPVLDCFGVRFRALASTAPDARVHIAELSAFSYGAAAADAVLV
jgi:alpha-L-fucosidase